MQWLIALAVFLAFLFGLPYLLKKVKSAKHGAGGAISLAVGLAFSSFLEPVKKAAMENMEKQKEIGRSESQSEGEV